MAKIIGIEVAKCNRSCSADRNSNFTALVGRSKSDGRISTKPQFIRRCKLDGERIGFFQKAESGERNGSHGSREAQASVQVRYSASEAQWERSAHRGPGVAARYLVRYFTS